MNTVNLDKMFQKFIIDNLNLIQPLGVCIHFFIVEYLDFDNLSTVLKQFIILYIY